MNSFFNLFVLNKKQMSTSIPIQFQWKFLKLIRIDENFEPTLDQKLVYNFGEKKVEKS